MYWLKGCEKCGGDLYLGEDKYGSFVSCLQCGAVRADLGDSVPAGISAITGDFGRTA